VSAQRLSDAEFADALHDVFGLALSPKEIAHLITILPPYTEAPADCTSDEVRPGALGNGSRGQLLPGSLHTTGAALVPTEKSIGLSGGSSICAPTGGVSCTPCRPTRTLSSAGWTLRKDWYITFRLVPLSRR
jgi:hypothetical protein